MGLEARRALVSDQAPNLAPAIRMDSPYQASVRQRTDVVPGILSVRGPLPTRHTRKVERRIIPDDLVVGRIRHFDPSTRYVERAP
jgi:hypothetical protein